VDLGYPGVLPVLNGAAVRMAVVFGLATDATVAARSVFARKNYFYPDLPKGYQISQYELPVVHDGRIEIRLDSGERKTIGITRAHLEEDAGKSLHENYQGLSGIDLNRAGTPLLEIVSEPDLRSAKEAVAYMKAIHQLVRYLGICDGNLQEGSFRCDANVSVRPRGRHEFGTRTETKNLNSFRFVERAINHEVERQVDILESGGRVVQETRLYDPDRDETRPMRTKEEANDYRYFPDPDLLPLVVGTDMVDAARASMPELPWVKRDRFVEQYGLSEYDADVLTVSRASADYYEAVVRSGIDPKLAANWVTGELAGALNKAGLDIADSPVDSKSLVQILVRVEDGTISGKLAKDVFEEVWASATSADGTPVSADEVIESKGLRQITDAGAVEAVIREVMAANPQQLEQYRSGKDKLFGFFVGQVMKATGSKANPTLVNDLLKSMLADR
jgi:aspartyl-tRNA(Asn)/glutamyl-tRNA(Gln) amidotransferase subunit B